MSDKRRVTTYTRGVASPRGGGYGALLVCDGGRKELSGGEAGASKNCVGPHVELFADPAGIGTRAGWERRLSEAGFVLRGHRLLRISGARPAGPA